MGLDFKESDARWSYSGFNAFRTRLAAEIGITLDNMRGFVRSDDSGKVGLPWDNVQDPIVPLLNHSDCDGTLTAAECRKVAPRLAELVRAWPEDDYDKIMALKLAESMARLGKENKKLHFC